MNNTIYDQCSYQKKKNEVRRASDYNVSGVFYDQNGECLHSSVGYLSDATNGISMKNVDIDSALRGQTVLESKLKEKAKIVPSSYKFSIPCKTNPIIQYNRPRKVCTKNNEMDVSSYSFNELMFNPQNFTDSNTKYGANSRMATKRVFKKMIDQTTTGLTSDEGYYCILGDLNCAKVNF